VADPKKIVIIGATSSIAEHCARLWVQKGSVEMILVGRDLERTQRVAQDLRVRNQKAKVQIVQMDFLSPESISKEVGAMFGEKPVDMVLIAHGSLPDQQVCQDDLKLCREALEVNAISPVLFAEAFAQHMAQSDSGTLGLISSVAGDRGRKSNYVYGAAKGLVSRYSQGLQHRFAGSGVKIVLIKPGPTDTPMTAHLKSQGVKMIPVEKAAKSIVVAMDNSRTVVYVTSIWQLIMLVLRHLPSFIFKRLDI